MTYTPVRRSEARAAQPNPDSTLAPPAALRTVILATLADAFALNTEELTWTGMRLDEAIAPLLEAQPTSVPMSVREEMLTGSWSAHLNRHQARPAPAGVVFDHATRQASLDDWVGVFEQLVTECYALSASQVAHLRTQLVDTLRPLGIGDPTRPRPSQYLPADVRHRINQH